MSELTTAARPYARAVFEKANENNTLTQWSETLNFMGIVANNEDVRLILDNPKLTKQHTADVFVQLCDGKLDKEAKNLVKLLAKNTRLSVLPEIASLFEALKSDAEGSINAKVTSAHKLNKAEKASIKDALKKRLGRKVKLHINIDKTLLSGAIIQAGDLVIDGSVQGRLQKLTHTLNG